MNYIKKVIIVGLVAGMAIGVTEKALANDYSDAVLGHVVTNSSEINHQQLLESEMQRIAHAMSLQMISALQAHLPAILDGMAADLRMKADSNYKCSMLKDTKIADKECQ